MTHKVHPKIFRINETGGWNSRWLSKKKFHEMLEEDFKIRKYLKEKIGKFGLEKIEIERFSNKIIIILYSARPGLIIGRGGGGVESLKKELVNFLFVNKKEKKEIKIDIKEIRDVWSSASLASQWAAQQIEKRVNHRRVLKQTIEKIMSVKGVQGCKIEVSGRLNGSEIARREWLKKGRLPLQTIRADIDYGQFEAHCTYGTIGLKVWIYKGEKFLK